MQQMYLMVLFALASGPAWSSGFGPFVPYNIERTTPRALEEIRTSKHWGVFLREMSANAHVTEVEMNERLKNSPETHSCPDCSVLIAGVNGAGAVRYSWRQVKPGEQIACEGRACFSTYCLNPIREIRGLPHVPKSACKTGPEHVATESVELPGSGWGGYYIGNSGFSWRHSSYPVECIFETEGVK